MDGVSAVINAIGLVYLKYQSFQVLKKENEEFRQSLLAVQHVLQSIREEERFINRVALSKPLEMIDEAVKMGEQVMIKCSQTRNKLRLILTCEEYLVALKTAGDKMDRGLHMISATSVTIQADVQRSLADAEQTMESMQSTLATHQNDVAEVLLDIVMPGLERIPHEVINRLRGMHIVSSEQDCVDQISDIQQDPNLRNSKELYNEQLLQWALNISLPPTRPDRPPIADEINAFPPENSSGRPPMTDEIKQMLTCPISLDYMRDPVTLIQTRQTYDREFLCEWLLEDPTRCPVTNRCFTEKLEYDDNLTARQLLMLYLGDDAYQPYDDAIFKRQYTAMWKKIAGENDTSSLSTEHAVPTTTTRPAPTAATRTEPRAALNDSTNDANMRERTEQGDAVAQFNLGICYANGRGVPQDYKQARLCYERAAGLGHAAAQSNLGSMYFKGQGVPRNYKRALLLYELAATQGNASAQCNLGILYEHGLGVQKDCNQAMHFYEQAAAQGRAKAQSMLNRPKGYNKPPSSSDDHPSPPAELPALSPPSRPLPRETLDGAIDANVRLVEQDDAVAQFNLGVCYTIGRGVPQDYEQARLCYERAAELGHASAQANLGSLYYKGQGVPKDYESARQWYELSATQGNSSAQCNLGILYEYGLGAPKDYDQAKYFYEQAAAQGHTKAQDMLKRSKAQPKKANRPRQKDSGKNRATTEQQRIRNGQVR